MTASAVTPLVYLLVHAWRVLKAEQLGTRDQAWMAAERVFHPLGFDIAAGRVSLPQGGTARVPRAQRCDSGWQLRACLQQRLSLA